MRTTTETGIDVRRMRRAPTRPGEVLLEEFLAPLGMSQAEAARRMGMSTNRLNELVRGKRGVTADTALRLAALLEPRRSSGSTSRWPPTSGTPIRRSDDGAPPDGLEEKLSA